MPHVQELASDLQAELQKYVIPNIRTEIILDPDGDNIDLSSYIDQSADIIIRKQKSIQPGNYGRLQISELNIKMLHKDNYLNPNHPDSIFHHITTRLYADADSADSYIDVSIADDAGDFSIGDKIIISDGVNSVEKTITGIATYINYYRFTFSGTLGYNINAGNLVETKYYPGSVITIKQLIGSATTKINHFYGRLKKLPNVNEGGITLTLYDRLKELQDKTVKANDYRIVTNSHGGYQSTQVYSHNNGDTYYANEGYTPFKFFCRGVSTTPNIGAVYRNNGQEFTVLNVDDISDEVGYIIFDHSHGSGSPSGAIGTLTKVYGNGDATLNYTEYIEEGLLNLDAITIDETKCKIGDWSIRFFDNFNEFKITDPDGIVYSGDTSSNFYFGSASDYQIYIPSTAWDGDFKNRDLIQFSMALVFGGAANNINTIPTMIENLLTGDYGACLTSADIDTATFSTLNTDYAHMYGSINIREPMTVLRAIEILQIHIMGMLYITAAGKFSISVIRPKQLPASYYTLSPDADIQEVELDHLDKVDGFIGYYSYDYNSSKYIKKIVKPDRADKAGSLQPLYFPAYSETDFAQAKNVTERHFIFWRRGPKEYRIIEKFSSGVAFELDEFYSVSSEHPYFAGKILFIIGLEKHLNSGQLVYTAIDYNLMFGNYCFIDIDHLDRGKVVW